MGERLPESCSRQSSTDIARILTNKNDTDRHTIQMYSDTKVKRIWPTTHRRFATAKLRTNPAGKRNGKSTHNSSHSVDTCQGNRALTISVSSRSRASSGGSIPCDRGPTCDSYCKIRNSNQKCSFDDKWRDSLSPRLVAIAKILHSMILFKWCLTAADNFIRPSWLGKPTGRY